MRKFVIINFLILITLIFSSCTMNESGTLDRLASPNNIKPPIEGKWIISDYIDTNNIGDEKNSEDLIGREGLFHRDAVILGNDYTTNPSFKVKNIKSTDYFIYKYKINPEDLNIYKEELKIITILNDNQYFNEFIQIDNDILIVNIDNIFYKMEQVLELVSLEETKRYIDIEKTMIRDTNTTESEKKETGLLLGLKIPSYDNINQLPSWKYKTIWIRANDSNILEAYEIEDLIIPRKKGFWKIKVDRKVQGEDIKDIVITNSDKDSINEYSNMGTSKISNYKAFSPSSVLKNIMFVGNNYITIEEITNKDDDRRIINTFAIDNLQNETPIKLSYFIGEAGKDIFLEGVQNVISLEDAPSINEANIGLVRNKGHWIFNGRVNYIQNDKELFKDFNIRAIPPKDIISYDDNLIPWEAVKRKIPDAIDMYFSPNREFIVVLTNYNIQIFNIENNDNIGQLPVKKINLPKNASAVMSEWAVGRYVELWEREIINRGGLVLDE